jgi:hypothetical protein
MSEPQANYETGRPPDFASAPWRAERLEAGGEIDGSAAVWASDGDLVASVHAGIGGTRIERGIDRARLIAAAGTAAHEVQEMGYDPVAFTKNSVHLLRELENIANGHIEDGMTPAEVAQNALASAEGSEE